MNQYKLEYTMSQAAMMLGVHRDTITYWEENNLIPPARRNPNNNYRIYDIDEVMELAHIRGISNVDVDVVERVKNHRREQRLKKQNMGNHEDHFNPA
jgi:DNA-binding transcriptional MerR regulator